MAAATVWSHPTAPLAAPPPAGLLGAGGATKDVAGAARLLEQAAPQARESSLWQAAKAVQLLNQEALPDDIRAAAQDLDRAADKGLVEARYWQARILLAEQSPLHDARQGLRVLTQAADKGHAHAALMLGNKLAKGEDTRRDVRAYRQSELDCALDCTLVEHGQHTRKCQIHRAGLRVGCGAKCSRRPAENFRFSRKLRVRFKTDHYFPLHDHLSFLFGRSTGVPISGQLKLMRHIQQFRFVEVIANQL